MSYTYQHMSDFLNGGRKKYERPAYDRGLRVWKENQWAHNTDIHIGWTFSGKLPFVTWHADGTTTIHGHSNNRLNYHGWSPLGSQSVRLTIRRYAGISVYQRDFKFYLEEDGAPLTPPKIQGCRSCKQSGLVDGWCNSTTCWNGEFYQINSGQSVFACPEHPDAEQPYPSSYYRYHKILCEHGSLDNHSTPKTQQCYYCKGSGKRDYGSKPLRTLWSGQPLRLRDGKIIQTKASQSLLERMMADVVETVS